MSTYSRSVTAALFFTALLQPAGGMSAPLAPMSPAAPVGSPAAVSRAADSYLLGAGDKIRIIVYGEDALTGEYSVTDSGLISFPLIGDVPARGSSLAQVQTIIHDRLANGYIKDPRVSVEVLNYRPFYILGEVNKPGEYPYTSGLTLQQAVATAGGYTYRANPRRAAIKGALDTRERSVDLRKGAPLKIEPGDTIRIIERFF